MSVDDDAVTFEPALVRVGLIREEQTYGGVRVDISAHIGAAKLRLQVDVGFGDAVTPHAELASFPPLLDFPAPRLRAYPKETVIAEKVEAMVQLGMANSRMKDFFDVMVLAGMYAFDGQLLARALKATFQRRGTPLPALRPIAWTPAFATDAMKQTQWTAFLRKSGATTSPRALDQVIGDVASFAWPPLEAAALGRNFEQRWPAGGPWT
jgi:hypothetical protein